MSQSDSETVSQFGLASFRLESMAMLEVLKRSVDGLDIVLESMEGMALSNPNLQNHAARQITLLAVRGDLQQLIENVETVATCRNGDTYSHQDLKMIALGMNAVAESIRFILLAVASTFAKHGDNIPNEVHSSVFAEMNRLQGIITKANEAYASPQVLQSVFT